MYIPVEFTHVEMGEVGAGSERRWGRGEAVAHSPRTGGGAVGRAEG